MRLPNPFRRRRIAPRAATLREAIEYDRDGYQGRRVKGGREDEVDLNVVERMRGMRMSRRLYHTSPAYGAVVDRFAEHVIGDGVVIEVDDPKAQEWLDAQLERPENRWSTTLGARLKRLMVDGEYLLTVTAPERSDGVPTGEFTLGRWDVENVGALQVSPWNADAVRGLTYRTDKDTADVPYPIAEPGCELVRRGAGGGPPVEGKRAVLVGVQFWRAATLGLRSGPLFTRVLDKTSTLDQTLETLSRKAEYLNRHYLHITYEPIGDTDLGPEKSKDLQFEEKALRWAQNQEPGEALVTSNKVKVEAHVPDLKSADTKAHYDVMLEWILGGHGIPRMWFSGGGDTNRATAAEQGSPIYRSIAAYQAYLQALIEDLVAFLLDLGKRAGMFQAVPEYRVVMSDVATRDSLRDADEVSRVLLWLNEAERRQDISRKEGQQIARSVIGGKTYGDALDEQAPGLYETGIGGIDLPQLRAVPKAAGDGPDERSALPADPAVAAAGAGATESGRASDAVWTGIQIQQLKETILQVARGELDKETAVKVLITAFPLTEAEARDLLATTIEGSISPEDAAAKAVARVRESARRSTLPVHRLVVRSR